MASTTPTYLRRSREGWVFRRAVPQRLRFRFCCIEITRSLMRISQADAVARARALGSACEALFMVVDGHPSLTSEEIGQLTAVFFANQESLFSARIANLGIGLSVASKALREEAEMRAEMAHETVSSIRAGISLFDRDAIATLAAQAGLDPARARDDRQVQDALAVALARHNQNCAERLARPPQPSLFERLFGSRGAPKPTSSHALGKPLPAPHHAGAFASLDRPLNLPVIVQAEAPTPCSAPPPLSKPMGQTAFSQAFPVPASMSFGYATVALKTTCLGQWTAAARIGQHPSNLIDASHRSSETLLPQSSSTDTSTDFANVRDEMDAQQKEISTGQRAAGSVREPQARPLWDGRITGVWDEFTESMLTTGQYKPSRKPELASTLRIVTWIMGADFSLAYSTESELAEFKRRYLSLPKDYKTLRIDYKNNACVRTYEEVMELVGEMAKNGVTIKTVKPKSFNKHKSTMSTAVDWATSHRTAIRPFVNRIRPLHIKVETSSHAAKLQRHMTPTNFLIALFKSPVWFGRLNTYHLCRPGQVIIRDSLYWVPLMETGNGLRREEACQLRVRHIVTKFGIWCYDLLAKDIKVKTADASPRLVAIQEHVLAAGFLEDRVFGRDADELLFPELSDDNAHGSFGESFGKRISNYVARVDLDLSFLDEELLATIPDGTRDRASVLADMKSKLVVDFRERFTNHGIRHWWKTQAINSECHQSFVDDNLGHVGETRGEGGRYLKEIWIQNLKKMVDTVPMPFDGAELKKRAEASGPDDRRTTMPS